jgi:hypothetical protein
VERPDQPQVSLPRSPGGLQRAGDFCPASLLHSLALGFPSALSRLQVQLLLPPGDGDGAEHPADGRVSLRHLACDVQRGAAVKPCSRRP